VKGMWRKGITLLAIDLVVVGVLIVVDASDSVSRAVSMGCCVAAALLANYAYYLHVTQRSTSWNVMEGFRRERR
jgi:threonine/homoserine efflux transporter RhtA